MRRFVAFAAIAAVAIAVAAGILRAPSRQQPPAAATVRGGTDAALRADAYVVALSPVRDSVHTVGTLAANESVRMVAELSRRLERIAVAEGAVVERDDLLFKLDDADLRARLAELEVRRRLAARTEERQRALLALDKKALSQQAYDQAVAELDAVRAEMTSVRVTLAKTEIRAPFRGRVGLRHVSEGAWITPETLLTTLHDTSRIKIDFTVPERYAGAIAVGQSFRFQLAGGGDSFEARVAAIEPAIDAPTRSLLLRGLADNPSGALLPGAFVSVEVAVERGSNGIMLPAQALIPSATGHAVYVLRDGHAELSEIEIGLRTRDAVEVVRGLAVGDTVLTSNLLRLRPGVAVEAATP